MTVRISDMYSCLHKEILDRIDIAREAGDKELIRLLQDCIGALDMLQRDSEVLSTLRNLLSENGRAYVRPYGLWEKPSV